jgi:hypothetical protein
MTMRIQVLADMALHERTTRSAARDGREYKKQGDRHFQPDYSGFASGHSSQSIYEAKTEYERVVLGGLRPNKAESGVDPADVEAVINTHREPSN